MRLATISTTVLLCAAALTGCAASVHDGGDPADAEVIPENVVAELTLADGSRVEFHEPMPGELVVFGSGDTEAQRELFDSLERGEISYMDLYTQHAGVEAPATLFAALQFEIRDPCFAWRDGRAELAAWSDRLVPRPSLATTVPPARI